MRNIKYQPIIKVITATNKGGSEELRAERKRSDPRVLGSSVTLAAKTSVKLAAKSWCKITLGELSFSVTLSEQQKITADNKGNNRD